MSPAEPGIWQLIVSRICKQQKTCLVTSCRHFRQRSRVKISNTVILDKTRIYRPWPKKQNHLLCLCSVGVPHFVTCFMQFYWAETVTFIRKMVTNIFYNVLIDWGPGIWPFFQMPGVCRGRGYARGWNWPPHYMSRRKTLQGANNAANYTLCSYVLSFLFQFLFNTSNVPKGMWNVFLK